MEIQVLKVMVMSTFQFKKVDKSALFKNLLFMLLKKHKKLK